ncbi:ABATE domain-containing protein [Streptomyces sp. TS71-3]|uniref:CGNR zinc finger domain-containing protein n=1 Tax=Streptomyces sp. TS71-3 TaxID=2733862 RepID=UPI001B12D383|nr:CGNR zinc finger domain-containing protein [Streptomyces sp. TS71-3]GHJ37487.1 hypothetical protein Sm713_30960 [Streptomyces sp. TS71-3]
MEHAFVCGNPALDFLVTLRARRTARLEVLTSPGRLVDWHVESGLVDSVTACHEFDLQQAVGVREAIYELVGARRAGQEYGAQALALVNGAARVPAATPQLTPSGRWTQATAVEALSLVARHAVELLGGPDVPLLKECGNPECTRIYIDRSRGMRRQWCGMESCGNKIKAAAYRARKKQTGAAALA